MVVGLVTVVMGGVCKVSEWSGVAVRVAVKVGDVPLREGMCWKGMGWVIDRRDGL